MTFPSDGGVMMINRQEAVEAANIGIARAVGAAERQTPGWVEEAAGWIGWGASRILAETFTIEDLRAFIEAESPGSLPKPPDLRTWGGATRMAKQHGFIVLTGGYRFAASSNGSPKPLYRFGVWP